MRTVQNLFRRNEWNDWFTQGDIKWYLQKAFYMVSAWKGTTLAGLGLLKGDGRIQLELGDMLVDERFRGLGIGTAILERLVAKAESCRPYWFTTDACEPKTEALYAKFGFRRNVGQVMLTHGPLHARWAPGATKSRESRRQRKPTQQ